MIGKKAFCMMMFLGCLAGGEWAFSAEPPPDRVVVMYFHRTQRCPTCMRMESYARQALEEAFSEQLQTGQIAFYSIDFQDERNARLTRAYQITGPTLIMVKVVNKKGMESKNLQEIWAKVRDQKEFFRYVQTEAAGYLPKSAPRSASR